MAIILDRQKDKSMKVSYTGMDAVMKGASEFGKVASKVVKTAASLPGKYVNHVIKVNEDVMKAKKAKQKKDIERAFGSVDNYNRMNGLMP